MTGRQHDVGRDEGSRARDGALGVDRDDRRVVAAVGHARRRGHDVGARRGLREGRQGLSGAPRDQREDGQERNRDVHGDGRCEACAGSGRTTASRNEAQSSSSPTGPDGSWRVPRRTDRDGAPMAGSSAC